MSKETKVAKIIEAMKITDEAFKDCYEENVILTDKLKEANFMLLDCINIIKQCESTTIGQTNLNVKVIQIETFLNQKQ